MNLIHEDFALVAIPNAAAMAVATMGFLSPVGATILSNGSTVVAAMNSLRPLADKRGRANGHADQHQPLN